MSLTQKRYLQLPLLFCLIFFGVLPLEWTIFSKLPFYLGPLNVLAVVATYIALTRSLPQTVMWGLVIGFIAAIGYPFGFGPLIAAYAWSAMAAKLMTYALPFDSRVPFASLACFQLVVCKIIWRLATYKTYQGIPWLDFTLKNLPSLITTFCVAYALLPIFVLWDDFFENDPDSTTSDLNPSITGMKR